MVTECGWTHSTPGLRQKGPPPVVGFFSFWQIPGTQAPRQSTQALGRHISATPTNVTWPSPVSGVGRLFCHGSGQSRGEARYDLGHCEEGHRHMHTYSLESGFRPVELSTLQPSAFQGIVPAPLTQNHLGCLYGDVLMPGPPHTCRVLLSGWGQMPASLTCSLDSSVDSGKWGWQGLLPS